MDPFKWKESQQLIDLMESSFTMTKFYEFSGGLRAQIELDMGDVPQSGSSRFIPAQLSFVLFQVRI